MNFKKTLLSTGTIVAAALPVATVVSCGGKSIENRGEQKIAAGEIFGRLAKGIEGWDNNIKIGIHPSQSLSKDDIEKIEQAAGEYNRIIASPGFIGGYVDHLLARNKIDQRLHDQLVNKSFNVSVKVIDSQQAIATSLDTGEIDYSFLPSGISVKYNKKHNGIVPELIASRQADIFEEMTNDGFPTKTPDEYQTKLEEEIQLAHRAHPAPADGTGYQFLEHTYNDAYHSSSAYRAQIFISGNAAERSAIKRAWENHDWKTFKSFGIAAKASSSESGYLIPEKMLKKQFGSQFSTLANEAKNDNQHVKIGVHPDASLKSGIAKIGFSFSSNPLQGRSKSKWPGLGTIDVLASSAAIPNDILVARGGLNKVEAEIISILIEEGLSRNPHIKTSGAFYHAGYNEIFDWESKQQLVDSIHALDNYYTNPNDLYK